MATKTLHIRQPCCKCKRMISIKGAIDVSDKPEKVSVVLTCMFCRTQTTVYYDEKGNRVDPKRIIDENTLVGPEHMGVVNDKAEETPKNS